MDLRGRVALVTGGAGHIGRAICESFAELGAAVAVVDLEPASCDEVASSLASRFEVPTLALSTDLEDSAAILEIPGQVESELGGLGVLVNCAALVGSSSLSGWNAPLAEQSIEAWRRALEVNLTAAFALTQSSAPLLQQSGHGSVVNVGSIYGVVGSVPALYEGTAMHNPAAYAASKGGLVQLTRWLATELAPNVRVNALSPGGLWRNQPSAFRERYEARTPLGRMAVEEDLKGAAAFLASDLSSYVTGQNLLVDGGWTAW